MAADAIKATSKKVILKIVDVTSDLIVNKIANIVKKNLPKDNSETSSQAKGRSIKIPKKWYIPSEKRQQIISELKLIY